MSSNWSKRERDEIFALIEPFDSQPTEEFPFVRVATGKTTRLDDDPPRNHYRFGFLENTGISNFTVRYLDLTREKLTVTPKNTAEHERVGYENWDMASYARELTDNLRVPAGDFDEYYDFLENHTCPENPMSPKARAILLARACARRGLQSEVDELFDAVGSRGEAAHTLADAFDNILTLDFTVPTLSWADLRQRHERRLDAFPQDGLLREFILDRTRVLNVMAAQDRARKTRTGQVKFTDDVVVADLIYSLRDEFHPVKIGDYVSTTAERPADGSRPSDRLRKLGRVAVPALIAAITDETLSRTVFYNCRHGGSFEVIPVEIFARELLEEVTNVTFYGDAKECQKQWQQWWRTNSDA